MSAKVKLSWSSQMGVFCCNLSCLLLTKIIVPSLKWRPGLNPWKIFKRAVNASGIEPLFDIQRRRENWLYHHHLLATTASIVVLGGLDTISAIFWTRTNSNGEIWAAAAAKSVHISGENGRPTTTTQKRRRRGTWCRCSMEQHVNNLLSQVSSFPLEKFSSTLTLIVRRQCSSSSSSGIIIGHFCNSMRLEKRLAVATLITNRTKGGQLRNIWMVFVLPLWVHYFKCV